MLNEVNIQAPAKVNLHLRVLPKRVDGYHNIESLFQAIDLCDDLCVKRTGAQYGCKVEVIGIKLPPENTLTVAYSEFCTFTGIREGVTVKLTKRIYSGAGLGGGSSDGAALIQALDKLFETHLSHAQKAELVLPIGSDVPFFLSSGAAVVTGRGEFVREIDLRTNVFFLVIQPNVHSSTKEAFKLFDNWRGNGKALKFPDLAELESMYRMPVTNWTFRNSFTEPLAERYPPIAKALASVIQHGAMFSEMSGSGSAVYGVFCSEKDAEKAYTQLCLEWKCWLARPYSIGSRSI